MMILSKSFCQYKHWTTPQVKKWSLISQSFFVHYSFLKAVAYFFCVHPVRETPAEVDVSRVVVDVDPTDEGQLTADDRK